MLQKFITTDLNRLRQEVNDEYNNIDKQFHQHRNQFQSLNTNDIIDGEEANDEIKQNGANPETLLLLFVIRYNREFQSHMQT